MVEYISISINELVEMIQLLQRFIASNQIEYDI